MKGMKSYQGKKEEPYLIFGSITIEASIGVPIFFLGIVCLIYLIEIMCIGSAIKSGLDAASRNYSKEAYLVPLVQPGKIKSDLVAYVGADRINSSIISGSIDCSKSKVSGLSGVADLYAKYKVSIPIPYFNARGLEYEKHIRVKGFRGYEGSGLNLKEDTVFVTETGVVYHLDRNCRHLDLSITEVPFLGLDGMRNDSGGKYHKCEKCGNSGSGMVFITSDGTKYHSDINCSGLKRTIYQIPISEATHLRPCSKCG
ncbi:MAG: pilus assembly protein [Lachnospiraceae bacterium]|jgi:hypothetical protein|nr:pilus assembly protein [Lachnospiraceae bacterium]